MTANQRRKYAELLADLREQIVAAETLVAVGDLRGVESAMFAISRDAERIHEAVMISAAPAAE